MIRLDCVKNKVWVGYQVWDQVVDQLAEPLRNKVSAQVWWQVGGQMKKLGQKFTHFTQFKV
jgi:hypothetical protein